MSTSMVIDNHWRKSWRDDMINTFNKNSPPRPGHRTRTSHLNVMSFDRHCIHPPHKIMHYQQCHQVTSISMYVSIDELAIILKSRTPSVFDLLFVTFGQSIIMEWRSAWRHARWDCFVYRTRLDPIDFISLLIDCTNKISITSKWRRSTIVRNPRHYYWINKLRWLYQDQRLPEE